MFKIIWLYWEKRIKTTRHSAPRMAITQINEEQQQLLARIWRKQNPSALLAGI